MASYARKTIVYGTGSAHIKKSNYNRQADPFSPEKVNEFTEEFDELIKNRHLGREGIIHFEAPNQKRNRKMEEQVIKQLNGKFIRYCNTPLAYIFMGQKWIFVNHFQMRSLKPVQKKCLESQQTVSLLQKKNVWL